MSDTQEKKGLLHKLKDMPSGTRTLILGGSAFVLLTVAVSSCTDDPKARHTPKEKVSSTNLTINNANDRNYSTEQLATNLALTDKKVKELTSQNEMLAKMLQEKGQGGDLNGQWSQVSSLVSTVQELRTEVNALRSGVLNQPLPSGASSSKTGSNGSTSGVSVGGTDASLGSANSTPLSPSAIYVPTVQVVGASRPPIAVRAKDATPTAYLPAGSNFEAVLLNGMDASTALSANRSPSPALLRIKSEAILPNHYSYNLRECFILVGGFGNLSSERVEMRTELMSCLDEKGKAWEGKVEAYVVGEDGKVGARGRVKTKQGALLAKTFAAGLLGGLSQAFQPQQIQSLNLGGTSSNYVIPTTDQALAASMSSGLATSSNALMQFYLKMAEQMFPVVELDAGRKMTVIFMKGVEMTPESPKS